MDDLDLSFLDRFAHEMEAAQPEQLSVASSGHQFEHAGASYVRVAKEAACRFDVDERSGEHSHGAAQRREERRQAWGDIDSSRRVDTALQTEGGTDS